MADQILFSLLYTSRRAALIEGVLRNWFSKAANSDYVEAIITVDADYPEGIEAAKKALVALQPHKVSMGIQSEMPSNCVKGWNLAARMSRGRVLMTISDDFDCPPKWDLELLSLTPGASWTLHDHAVHVNDGFVSDLCTIGIMTRKRYNKFGYYYYPEYESMFCDTDFTYRAKLDGVLIDAMHLLFEHRHCDNRKRQRDGVDNNHSNSTRWKRGELLFNYRKDRGFPIDAGPRAREILLREALGETSGKTAPASKAEVKPEEEPEKKPEVITVQDVFPPAGEEVVKRAAIYAVYLQCIKDDFELFEICKRLFEEGLRHFFFCIPDEYWSGKRTPEEDVREVITASEKLKKLGAFTKAKMFNVAKYRNQDLSRTGIETLVRNESIRWIHDQGFNHILIVDGDELWRRGLFRKLHDLVRTVHPQSVTTGMVPVVGLPGFPVDQAKDRVTIYIRGDTTFRDCRSPYGPAAHIPSYDVIHFTSTRRSMDEIVGKLRESGHYDDPKYDFEGFIKNVLPKVRPGLKNIHMYKDYQIWPSLRTWTPEELADIPSAIRPFVSLDTVAPSVGPNDEALETSMVPIVVPAPPKMPSPEEVAEEERQRARAERIRETLESTEAEPALIALDTYAKQRAARTDAPPSVKWKTSTTGAATAKGVPKANPRTPSRIESFVRK